MSESIAAGVLESPEHQAEAGPQAQEQKAPGQQAKAQQQQQQPSFWGFRVLVCRRRFHAPDAVPQGVKAIALDLKALSTDDNVTAAEAPFGASAALDSWTPEADAALVRWFNERAEQQSCGVLDVDPAHFSQSSSDFQGKFAALAGIPAPVLMFRASVIQALNCLVRRCLPWLDLGCAASDSLLSKLVRKRAHLFFAEIKGTMLTSVRDRTRGTGGANTTITLDNFLASESLESGATSVADSNSCFAQAFRELHGRDPTFLRSCWDGDRVFQVNFRGSTALTRAVYSARACRAAWKTSTRVRSTCWRRRRTIAARRALVPTGGFRMWRSLTPRGRGRCYAS